MAEREKEFYKREVEVFGVTYDRYVLLNLHSILTIDLGLKKIVEMPSHGAKAAGSLYSIGFGLAGCNVTLVNPEQDMIYRWNELGLGNNVQTVKCTDVCNTSFNDNSFDLAWNFVTWTELERPELFLKEMKRISKKYVLLITCNNFQPGYPWHRFLHMIFGIPWTHGQVRYNHITKVKWMFDKAGLNVIEYGAIDTPGWPDPSGPRDVRLHRRYGKNLLNKNGRKPVWEIPFIEYIKSGKFPGWMVYLGKWDMAFRKGVFKLPLSHLFYVLGIK